MTSIQDPYSAPPDIQAPATVPPLWDPIPPPPNVFESRIESLIRMCGPIRGGQGNDHETCEALDVPTAHMWRWFAIRALTKALITEATTPFAELCQRFEPLYESGLIHADEEEFDLRMNSELDKWAETYNLSGEEAFGLRLMIRWEAEERALEKVFGILRSDAKVALDRWQAVLTIGWRLIPALPITEFPPPMFGLDEWDTATLSQDRYEAAQRTRFERVLAEYSEQQSARLNARNSEPVVKKKRHAAKHFAWYIRFQVLEHSMGEIAKSSGDATKNAVSLGIHDIVELTGLPLRPGSKGGAPRKRRDPVVKTVKYSPPA